MGGSSPRVRDAGAVKKFTFNLTGSSGGAKVLFRATQDGSDEVFCVEVELGRRSVELADLTHNCSSKASASATLDTSKLLRLEWVIPPKIGNESTVTDLCVDSLGHSTRAR